MPTNDGLDGVVVAETSISGIDGEAGRLWIRGHDVEALASERGYEEILGLLWEGRLPADSERARWQDELGRARAEIEPARFETALAAANAMDALRAATASLEAGNSKPRQLQLRIAGALPVFAAAWLRRQTGALPLLADPTLGHAEDFLRMLGGAAPSPARIRALDRYWVTVAEHGMNASTFAARVVASTHADPISSVTAALGALSGPLHGGAPGPVLDMLDITSGPQQTEAWVRAELSAGRRIMGLGHRVYRVRDPRAAVLEDAVRELGEAGIHSRYLEPARELEQIAVRVLAERHPKRPLAANVELYTAVLLDSLGLDRPLFTAVFAAARVAGWLAHDAEQRSSGRILRPRQRYIGARPLPQTTVSA